MHDKKTAAGAAAGGRTVCGSLDALLLVVIGLHLDTLDDLLGRTSRQAESQIQPVGFVTDVEQVAVGYVLRHEPLHRLLVVEPGVGKPGFALLSAQDANAA